MAAEYKTDESDGYPKDPDHDESDDLDGQRLAIHLGRQQTRQRLADLNHSLVRASHVLHTDVLGDKDQRDSAYHNWLSIGSRR